MELITKREAFKKLQLFIEERLPVPVIDKKAVWNKVIFFTEKDCKIEITFDTVLGGSKGKGSFSINYHLKVYNPFIDKVTSELLNVSPDSPVLILRPYNIPFEDSFYDKYFICEGRDNSKVLEGIAEEIKTYFGQYIRFFTVDPTGILDVYTQYDFYKNIGFPQFIYGVIFALLSDNKSFIEDELVPTVLKSEVKSDFRDFKRFENYKEEIILPIKKYIEEQKRT